ncbi:MAG: DUF2232 domain-containing protein [Acidobacteria bacterium]|nr:DUF2232 domain-containing protein [Acidobacteriota bacterium]MBV9477052.1 DUF2232 domain-containing protein [Acidobacteriota bacterium]
MSLPPQADLQSEPAPLPARSFGRVARSVAGYSAATALMVVTPMLVFVPAALFHCAVRNGRRAAYLAATLAMMLAAAYVAATPSSAPGAMQMAWSYLAAVALAIVVPSLAALPLIERGESFGRVLMFLLVGSAVGLTVTEAASRLLAAYSPYAAQLAQAKLTGVYLIRQYHEKGIPADLIEAVQRWIGYSIFALTAVILINVTLVFVLSLLMLGRLKAWRALAARRTDTQTAGAYFFRNLALPDWLLFAFIVGGLTPLASGMLQKVAANVLALVAFLYILQGLAIFRFLLVSIGAGMAGTMLGWLLLAFLTITGVGPLLLGVAGLFDPFFDFRHFKKRKDDSHESHSD